MIDYDKAHTKIN